jgi:hypothetical protein
MSSPIQQIDALYTYASESNGEDLPANVFDPIGETILPAWFTSIHARSDIGTNRDATAWVDHMMEEWVTFFFHSQEPVRFRALLIRDSATGKYYMEEEKARELLSIIVPCFTMSRMNHECVWEVCMMVRYFLLLGAYAENILNDTGLITMEQAQEAIPLYTTYHIYSDSRQFFRYIYQRDMWVFTKKNNEWIYKWIVPLSMKNSRLEPIAYNNEKDPNVQSLNHEEETHIHRMLRRQDEDDDNLSVSSQFIGDAL